MIGDHIIKDLKGAKAELNATTFHVSNAKPKKMSKFINHTLSDITELLSYIPKIINLAIFSCNCPIFSVFKRGSL